MTFAESYLKNLSKMKLFSLISTAFLFSLVFSECFDNIYSDWNYPNDGDSADYIKEQRIGLYFQILISILFLFRLSLVGFNKPKFIWLSQTFWLLNWITIYIFSYITTEIYHCCFGGDHFPSFFLRMKNYVSIWLLAYMLLSPIKQITTIIFAYFYRK